MLLMTLKRVEGGGGEGGRDMIQSSVGVNSQGYK